MSAYEDELNTSIDAWVEVELAASPEWGPERYAVIRRRLEDSAPAVPVEE